MPTLRWVAAMALVIVFAACGGAPNIVYDYAAEPDPRRSEVVIGVSDRLTIRVWKNPDLSTDATVRPDGIITMPLIGDLKAAGRTPTQLKEEITKQLQRYVRDEGAVVTVALGAMSSYSITVSGNVERPGVLRSDKFLTVLEAVQMAGGPNRYASPENMKLFRRTPDGQQKVIPINYARIEKGEGMAANLALFSGDQIYMP
jgi:polysaccharide export outer membrane protein